jgi:hypothetical protein
MKKLLFSSLLLASALSALAQKAPTSTSAETNSIRLTETYYANFEVRATVTNKTRSQLAVTVGESTETQTVLVNAGATVTVVFYQYGWQQMTATPYTYGGKPAPGGSVSIKILDMF